MKATIIQQAPLRLITAKSNRFPDGNRAAFEALEAHLETLRGRKFYGVANGATGGGMEYHAGLVPEGEVEERKFTALGFEITEIAGGCCARVKMADWASQVEQIGPTFVAMIEEFGIDPSRPQMEFYRSLSELHLLLPLPA